MSNPTLIGVVIIVSCWASASDVVAQQPGSSSTTEAKRLIVVTWNLEWFYDEHQGDNFSDLAK